MFKIEIFETKESAIEFAEMLRNIAASIEAGNTSGYDPGWSIDLES